MTHVRAVLFDCDGVLVDTEPPTREFLAARLTAAGMPISPEGVRDLFLGGTLAGVAQVARDRGARIGPDWVAETYEAMFAYLAPRTVPVDGAAALLDRLDAAGISFAVGSNGPARKMKVTLRVTGLTDRLHPHIYSAQEVGRPKPEPDVYLHAARALGHAPEACVVVEDSPTGARAARAAGMRCLGLTADADATALAAAGAEPIATLAEVPGKIGI
jgi:HAD superfamily hydrolase (TIGR01509 family)